MAIRKCPRCELNYILDDSPLCKICYEEVHGKVRKEETATLCSVCGMRPSLPGEDMCKNCLTEMRSIEMTPTGSEDEEESAELDASGMDDLDAMEPIDDLEIDDDDMPFEDEESAADDGDATEPLVEAYAEAN